MFESKFALLGFGTVVAAGLVAAYIGLVPGRQIVDQPSAVMSGSAQTQPAPAAKNSEPQIQSLTTEPETSAALGQAAPAPAPTIANNGAPTFDVLRVDPSGTIVIAGNAAKNATVDLLSRSNVIGTAKSTENGDFVIALDEPLKPGDYQLVLRSTGQDGTAITSLETAIVSIPETKSGQVLALVEQSGQPSRMITKPEPVETAAVTTQPVTVAAPKGDKPVAAPSEKPLITVEAVEIEGSKIFVAGNAQADSAVKVYANSALLGTTKTAPNGRFLVQTVQQLAVGDYIIRADMLGKDGVTVVARAAVPFKREAGERVSAVAPASTDADTQTETGAVSQAPQVGDAAAPLQSVDGSVIIRRGDSLWQISRRTYGAGMRYTTIYLANKEQIRNPDMIFPGQIFALPEKDKSVVQ
ncbi:LysM peptidoglycan-binding domain-containing protein [Phyllobacterium endophyticum]|uniref:Peptidase M23 n=1 Tax=Phyllobacterium endophyticum TaxID=1149773 RepID=A0A2P7AWN8_9HYPH|nr:LysM peptidoglycan-binding domain-containing protein [Phyllobacterium endophyticum]MBB3235252.1 nucleoid-associated protein YgaU [Phyllobacterium endophyticum]PSH58622.1 peptidase M23 [Phyllobacterium endophyticum]TYR39308.1 LysM peptidoglycan-binding domain-containing protein [Phyllobacterium endophyticum]